MPLTLQKLFLPAILMLHTLVSGQQLSPLSPEIGQMYSQGQEYMKMGNLAGAVTTYKEAILLAPTNIILYEALAGAYYGSGDFSAAEQTLLPILGNANADVECYRLAAASEAAQKNTKKARQTIKQGLNIFPASGILYREYGNVYNGEKQAAKALGAWLDGINKDPGYAYNYYEAANVYMASKNIMWGLLYAEMYLNMYHDTTGDETIKEKLFISWKKMFDNIARSETIQYGKTNTKAVAADFAGAIQQIYISLTPVISDGISAETLTMVRTRFLMDWFRAFGGKYPFTLFSYQDNLVRNGKFEIYNEWLFGQAENHEAFESWNTFHNGDIKRFLEWRNAHLLAPSATDFYNDSNMDGIE